MLRFYSIMLLLILLNACAFSQKKTIKKTESAAREFILKNAKNYDGLIEFYKSKLKKQDTADVRLKLAQVYINHNDAELALFTIQGLNKIKPTVEQLLVEATALFALKKDTKGINVLKKARSLNPKNGEVDNLLGVAYGALGKTTLARRYFLMAKLNLYDDIKIKNNLALIDIIENKPASAIKRLKPVYFNNQKDQVVKVNLMLAAAKSGNLILLKKLLGPSTSRVQAVQYFKALKRVKVSFPDAALRKKKFDTKTSKKLLPSKYQPLQKSVNNIRSVNTKKPVKKDDSNKKDQLKLKPSISRFGNNKR